MSEIDKIDKIDEIDDLLCDVNLSFNRLKK